MSAQNPSHPSSQLKFGESWTAGAMLIIAYVLLAILPVVLAFFFGVHEAGPFYLHLGLCAGLIGFSLLTLQVVLSARFKFIDRPFGHDIVMKFHKMMAVFALVLLVLHPVSFAISRGSLRLFTLAPSWKYWKVHLGQIALILLLLVVLCAISFKKFRIDYNRWRVLHKGVIFVVIFAFLHSFFIGPDFQPLRMKLYWIALFAIAAGIFLFRNIYMPLRGRRRFRVDSTNKVTHDTWNLVLKPEEGRVFPYRPGQFMFIKILREAKPVEEHPFTISSSPTQEGFITATIKESGNYTNTIGETKEGDTALVEAPLGRYSFQFHKSKSLLLIAGGVGITPFLSMLRYLRDTGDKRPVTLIYGNKTEGDIIFRQELEALPPHMKVVHVLSKPDETWKGPQGYVTAEVLKDHAAEELKNADIYLCGPPPMTEMLLGVMDEFGVDDERIHFERFEI